MNFWEKSNASLRRRSDSPCIGCSSFASFITRNKKYGHHQIICEPLKLIRDGNNREEIVEKICAWS